MCEKHFLVKTRIKVCPSELYIYCIDKLLIEFTEFGVLQENVQYSKSNSIYDIKLDHF